MHDVLVNREYHSNVAHKYHIKRALVSWIVRNFTKNPQLIDEIEISELNKTTNRLRVTSAAL